jgi:hypothetical protein
MHKRKTHDGDGIVYKEQKGFIKNINGCCEHSANVNYLIADACRRRKKLYLAALDCRDTFGSVSHQLMGINSEKIGIPRRLKNVIQDSYKNTQVRIYSNGSASEPIDILKGVKQGCPLSPLLFNLCVDPIITYLRKNENDWYVANKLKSTAIQAYADDMILVAILKKVYKNKLIGPRSFLTSQT